jgi:hypothetical protein
MNRISLLLLIAIFVSASSFTGKSRGGNMHVIRFSIKNADWQAIGVPGSRDFYLAYRYPCNFITNKVFDEGFVDVQVLGTNGAGWFSLPHTYFGDNAQQSVTFDYSSGYVELRYYGVSNMLLYTLAHRDYKLIIIPGPGKQ